MMSFYPLSTAFHRAGSEKVAKDLPSVARGDALRVELDADMIGAEASDAHEAHVAGIIRVLPRE